MLDKSIPILVGYIIIQCIAVTWVSALKYDIPQKNISVYANNTASSVTIGNHKFQILFQEVVNDPQRCGDSAVCIVWGDVTSPTLHFYETDDELHKWKLSMEFIPDSGTAFSIDLNGQHIYGGPQWFYWPAERNVLDNAPYVTFMDNIGSVAETYWYTSGGMAINVVSNPHLFVTQNSQQLQLKFENKMPYTSKNPSNIEIILCLGENAKDAFACFPHVPRVTDPKIIKDPIWSTWVKYKTDVSQDKVINFANEIRDHGFGISTMEIDDKWESCYGNHEWDKSKFPDPRSMVDELKSRGMYVTLWVHPFINVECDFFKEAEPYLYKLSDGTVGITQWWNGEAGLIDFTNPLATEWFKKRLLAMKDEYGLSGFKFDGGAAQFIPGIMNGSTLIDAPNNYTHEYTKMAASLGTTGLIQVGSRNSKSPIIQSIQDTNTHWEASGAGLRSVIPSMLTLNTLGYATTLADMIGGNLYNGESSMKEIFIRWLQLSTFFPVIQFSLPPWEFDNETVTISKMYAGFHAQYSDLFVKEIEGEHDDGHRVITPVWWYSPEDETALTIDSEFMVGTHILVAPVVEQGARSRDVYLPEGAWMSPLTGTLAVGPTILKNYSAPLNILPFFWRLPQH